MVYWRNVSSPTFIWKKMMMMKRNGINKENKMAMKNSSSGNNDNLTQN